MHAVHGVSIVFVGFSVPVWVSSVEPGQLGMALLTRTVSAGKERIISPLSLQQVPTSNNPNLD
jgi:hypothetical protein